MSIYLILAEKYRGYRGRGGKYFDDDDEDDDDFDPSNRDHESQMALFYI